MTLIERYYKQFVLPKVFALGGHNAERGHEWGLEQLRQLKWRRGKRLLARLACVYYDDRLSIRAFSIDFPNPLGLAAGFDKFGEVYPVVADFGWGSCDLGGICSHAQDGTPHSDEEPRLQRSVEYQALWNAMGFNNPGAFGLQSRLEGQPKALFPIGLNIGKSAAVSNEKAGLDYSLTVLCLWSFVDYLVINVSSPNTKDLRALQAAGSLGEIVAAVEGENKSSASRHRGTSAARLPLGIKIAPDLSDEQLADIVAAAGQSNSVNFIEAVNTTTSRERVAGWDIPADRGGVSGRPLTERAERLLAELHRELGRAGSKVELVGTGGIYDGRTLFRRILLGASVCRAYSAWVFEGPDFCKRTLLELVRLLKLNGFANVREAVGRAESVAALREFEGA